MFGRKEEEVEYYDSEVTPNYIKLGRDRRISVRAIVEYKLLGGKRVLLTTSKGEDIRVKLQVNNDEFDAIMGVWELPVIPE